MFDDMAGGGAGRERKKSGKRVRKKEGDFGKQMIVCENNLLAIRSNPAEHWGLLASQHTAPKSFNIISSVRPEPAVVAFAASFAAALIDVSFNPHPAERHLQITPQSRLPASFPQDDSR